MVSLLDMIDLVFKRAFDADTNRVSSYCTRALMWAKQNAGLPKPRDGSPWANSQEVCMRLLRVGQDWIRKTWFTADGDTIIVAEGNERHTARLHWHSLRDAKTTRTWRIPQSEFALSPDCSMIAQVEMEMPGWVEALHVRKLDRPDAGSMRIPLRWGVSSLAFSSDGQTLFTASFR